ncbi:hypothetical protein [Methylobacterium marchantiae]|uniref:Uncharacterized protein n=1 Tax=Methylobacterium marchantiae TaxID=600331 RepID=A0ABW3X3G1_9HYPH|nr:hypothetical protein AIGOOFII_4270 [Methylobacterium marchantiae]
MTVQNCRFSAIVSTFGTLALGAVLISSIASAQDAMTAPTGRPWTDPPDRRAPSSPVAGRHEKKAEAARRADTPVNLGQAAPIQREASTPGRSTTVKRPVIRKTVVRTVAQRVSPTERHGVRALAVASYPVRIAKNRNWTVRAYRPTYFETPGFRYGYTSDEITAYPRRDDRFIDARAARLRQAREAGYLVVRAGDLHRLRGRSLETIHDPEDQDDVED